MKISSQEEYGLRCLMQVARHSTENPVPISEIAMQEGLSVEYVGKLLMKLRKGELVSSVRGKAGGYVLARPAEEISLRLVLEVLSEPIYAPDYCERFAGTERTVKMSADVEEAVLYTFALGARRAVITVGPEVPGREIFLLLLEVAKSLDRTKLEEYRKNRNYEDLELFIIKTIMGRV